MTHVQVLSVPKYRGVEMPKETEDTDTQEPQTQAEGKKEENNYKTGSILSHYRTLIIVVLVAVIVIFILLPALVILLSTIWPDTFPGVAALKVLSDNVNKVIGAISVILGGISIYMAVKTDKVFQEQKQQQNSFMTHIEGYTRKMSESIDRLIYDRTKDKTGTTLQNPHEANEDDMRSRT